MHELNEWLRRQSEREQRAVYLEEALLGGRFWAYAVYRLRYFFARYAAASAVHAATVVLLARAFSGAAFVAVLAAYAGASLVGSFWWGALETMRGRVRQLYRSGKSHLITREIAGWLSLSLRLTALIGVGGMVGIVAHAAVAGRIGAADVYVLALVLRLGAELVTRCYHSGVYAVRRIYRPLPAIVGVEAAGLGAVLLLWPWAGAWAFPAAAVVSTALVTALTWHYTGRVYRFFGFTPVAELDHRRPHVPRGEQRRELLAAGAASCVMSLDAVLVLVALGTREGTVGRSALFVLFFAVAPTIRAGSEWAQLLYFDLKRLEIRPFGNLRRAFERRAFQLSLVLGVLFWGLACAIGTIVADRSLGDLYWLLLAFFLARSALAASQMQAFTERAYGHVLRTGAACVAGFVAAGLLLGGRPDALVAAVAAVAAAGAVVMRVRRPSLERTLRSHTLLPLSEWLADLSRVREPVRVASVKLWDPPGGLEPAQQTEARWRRRRFADQLARKLGGGSGVTLIDDSVIAWYERAAPGRLGEEWALVHAGGLAEWLGETGPAPDGPSALGLARGRGLLGSDLRRERRLDGREASPERVRRAFERTFPDGLVYDPAEPVPASVQALTASDKRLVIVDAAQFARDFRPSQGRSRFDVTAFCVGGELRQIFLIDRSVRARARARWRAQVRRFNLETALATAD